MKSLELKLLKRFPGFALDIHALIEPGFTALFGPSGSGKTTLLNMTAGLIRPDSGQIRLGRELLFSHDQAICLAPQKRNLGYIFQESRLFPHMAVRDNLRYGIKRTPPGSRKFSLDEIVAAAELGPLLGRRPHDLSGGEKQRVALARALLASPHYLLLDEPLTALDLPSRLGFLQFLKEIHHRYELPILYVSHDLSSVLNFAERALVIQNGRLVAYGPTYGILDSLHAAPLRSREDVPNVLQVTIASHDTARGITHVRAHDLNLTLPYLEKAAGEELLLNIPASEIIVALQPPELISATNILEGTVTQLHRLENRILLQVDAGVAFTVEIVSATVERLKLQTGRKVYLIIKASSFRRLDSS